MKTKTKVFLISGIAMIVVNFTIETLYPMIYNEYLNSIEECSPFRINGALVNSTTAREKIDKLLDLQQQNPAALEAMKQECESKTSPINLVILGWTSLALLLAGIALIIVAVVMIIKDKREKRGRQQQTAKEEDKEF
jgi:hypothetical protein